MQELMFAIPIPPLLALGFLIGVILLVMFFRMLAMGVRLHIIGGVAALFAALYPSVKALQAESV